MCVRFDEQAGNDLEAGSYLFISNLKNIVYWVRTEGQPNPHSPAFLLDVYSVKISRNELNYFILCDIFLETPVK
jgi:hypothetical protein